MDDNEPDNTTRGRSDDNTVCNPHLQLLSGDVLYHLALDTRVNNLKAMFSDVRFVCMGGTPRRMEQFARYIMSEIGHELPLGTRLADISRQSHRYAMYKVGPVLSVSHGMGIPSIGILLHEIIKLLQYADVIRDVVIFRLGTCGGIGIDGGNLVITEEAVDGNLNAYLEQPVLGRPQRRSSKLDPVLARELQGMSLESDPWRTYIGKTMCTSDFYEGQARLDGAFCEYTEADKMEFLNKIHRHGVINMEMESLMFAALCGHASIKAAVICVTLLNRLHGDQILESEDTMHEWQEFPQRLASRYIRRKLGLDK